MISGQQNNQFARLLALPLCQRIVKAIANNGGEARFVGGVIRDILAGQPLPQYPDLDMAMNIAPELAQEILQQEGLRVLPTGIDHGTITVFDPKSDKIKVELTTLRRDLDTDGRHAVVGFTDDWNEDAARRDFTINSIFLDADGQIIDLFNGCKDLAEGKVRFIGNATARIAEDYLRILRYFRFYGRFAKGAPDPEAVSAIKASKDGLAQISGERIAQELEGIVMQADPRGLAAMQDADIDQMISAKGINLEAYAEALDAMPDLPLPARYAVLFHDLEEGLKRLKLSNKTQQAARYFAAGSIDFNAVKGDGWRQAAWHMRPSFGDDLAALTAIKYVVGTARAGQEINLDAMRRIKDWDWPVFPLKGRDLIAIGYRASPALGDAMDGLETVWAEGGFAAGQSELIAEAKRKLLDEDS